MADNSAALRRARQHDSRAKRAQASEALNAMEQGGEPISFPAVARRAGVSVSLLYADTGLAGRIATARDRQRQAGGNRAWRLPTRSLVTQQSLRVELANAKERARRLAGEVTLLKERLAHDLGAGADAARGESYGPLLERLEQRSAELEGDNHQQRQRVLQLEADVRELTENLDAARAMNRELMNELNRGIVSEGSPRPSRAPR
jgi:hypothetical protein